MPSKDASKLLPPCTWAFKKTPLALRTSRQNCFPLHSYLKNSFRSNFPAGISHCCSMPSYERTRWHASRPMPFASYVFLHQVSLWPRALLCPECRCSRTLAVTRQPHDVSPSLPVRLVSRALLAAKAVDLSFAETLRARAILTAKNESATCILCSNIRSSKANLATGITPNGLLPDA